MSSRARKIASRTSRVALLAVFAAACDRSKGGPPTDSATTVATPTTVPSDSDELVASGWNVDAGPVIVLPAPDESWVVGALIRPEASELTLSDTTGLSASLGSAMVELFSRSGKVGLARLSVNAAPKVDSGCTAWPVARLAFDGSATVVPWNAAFIAGRVSAVPLDSIEGLSSRDSTRLATDLTRLASGLPNDTTATFRGLPYVVLRAWRTRGLDTGFVVATLARRINQEDSPQEERVVMVVDQRGPDARKWVVTWHERAAGREEELVVAEPLLAFKTGNSSDVHLLFGRDDGVAWGAAVLTRSAAGWQVQWESAVAGCD
ncbi:MAG: hypothetical protein IT353_08265 [Gemmatimonadaceae bacterium]|nr:hypothetical protein [Gemmatimonadaceae bacterium]